ncbi:hypothetical protein MBM_03246 [Drepanopeziza brunnea f. sp. 'multigermtubi' MB_m1]|uniref:Uncharacterized protein n=1 Tax=Marssonina brunnea f. sp. multigermtubi (strain MB_m1) TaxID=1072389 RepID=K1XBY7_MARBU|nr:uncharacterized protein MBM_03246 [Drepanopeziza brunnea f. sp. 'multigermtubi' MB_m1]EKD18253.1 hypothetical protein MBM_03246 [Drepanopeziza brunnea f. sp. 'multigermtubi' MB_m1]
MADVWKDSKYADFVLKRSLTELHSSPESTEQTSKAVCNLETPSNTNTTNNNNEVYGRLDSDKLFGGQEEQHSQRMRSKLLAPPQQPHTFAPAFKDPQSWPKLGGQPGVMNKRSPCQAKQQIAEAMARLKAIPADTPQSQKQQTRQQKYQTQDLESPTQHSHMTEKNWSPHSFNKKYATLNAPIQLPAERTKSHGWKYYPPSIVARLQ